MGGLDWAAVPTVVDLIGVNDIEMLLVQLAAIRDWQRNNPQEPN